MLLFSFTNLPDLNARFKISFLRSKKVSIIITIISRSCHCWPMSSPTSISICSLFLTSRSHLLRSQYHPTIFLLVSLYFFLFQVSTLYFYLPICHSPFVQGVPPKTISLHLFCPQCHLPLFFLLSICFAFYLSLLYQALIFPCFFVLLLAFLFVFW